MHTQTRYSISVLVFIVIALGIVAFFADRISVDLRNPFATNSPTESTAERTPPPAPPLTKDRTTAALATKSFSLLVSYTDQGFEPARATVHQGDMVRFTNNSTKTMWITSSNYPGKSACGISALDTCKELPPGEYYEFTFNKAGAWTFIDKTTNEQGSIQVK